jgi:hypothetical protein
MTIKGIPYNTVYQISRQYTPGFSISGGYVDCLKYVLDDVIKELVEASLCNLNESNNLRTFHSLQPLKRLHKDVLENTTKYKYLVEQFINLEAKDDNSIAILSLHRQLTTNDRN